MAKTVTKTVATRNMRTAAAPKPTDIRKRLKELVEATERNWFEFAQLAAEAYDTEMYRQWGYEDFTTYCQQELGFASASAYRMAMWRVQMGKKIKELGLKEAQVAKLGWTKFKELSNLLTTDMTTEEVKDLLGQAQAMSFRDVQEYVKKVRLTRTGSSEGATLRTFTFKLIDEDGAMVDNTLQSAMKLLGFDNPGAALVFVCEEWSLKHRGKVAPELMERLKQAYSKEPKEARVKHKEHAKPETKKKGKAKKEKVESETKEEDIDDLIL